MNKNLIEKILDENKDARFTFKINDKEDISYDSKDNNDKINVFDDYVVIYERSRKTYINLKFIKAIEVRTDKSMEAC